MMKQPNKTDVVVGTRVRLRRKELGLSQGRLADKLGITFQQVQKYEKGTNRIGASRLLAVAEALAVPVSYFFPDPGHRTVPDHFELLNSPGAVDLLRNYAQMDRTMQRALEQLTSVLARTSRG